MDIMYILLYLLLQILIAVYLNRYISNNTDFFLGGRNLPSFALAFSIFATWFGAETCIGSSGAVFSAGLSGSKAEPFGYGLCLVLSALVIARKLYKQSYTTLGDFFKDRYNITAERLLVWILIPSGLIWGAAQVRAFGQVISLYGGVDIHLAISFATAFVILYTLLSGMLGDIVTDVIQGGILAATLLVLLVFCFSELGGVTPALDAIEPSRWQLLGDEQNFWARLDSWLIPILGSLTAQELIQRTLAAKNKQQAVRAGLGGAWLYLFFGSIPVLLGLLGPQLGIRVEDSEQFLPALAQKILPGFLYVVFIGALISAILSTIDSILLAVSALVTQNVILPALKIHKSRQKLWLARLVLVVGGLIAYAIALYGESVYSMVEFASSFGTAGILEAFVGGLYWSRAGSITASLTMFFGLLLSFSFHSFLAIESQFSLSLLILSLFFVAGSWVEERVLSSRRLALSLRR